MTLRVVFGGNCRITLKKMKRACEQKRAGASRTDKSRAKKRHRIVEKVEKEQKRAKMSQKRAKMSQKEPKKSQKRVKNEPEMSVKQIKSAKKLTKRRRWWQKPPKMR